MISSSGSVAHCLNAGGMGRQDFETETMVAQAILAKSNSSHDESKETYVVAHSLRGEGFDASEDGTGRGTPIVPICFNSREDPEVTFDRSGPLGSSSPQAQAIAYGFEDRARGDDGRGYDRPPHFTEGLGPTIGTVKPPAVAHAIQAGALRENPDSGPDGVGVQADVAYTVEARAEVQAVAFDMRGREGGAQFEGPHETANVRAASGGSSRSYIAQQWAVRRLTPRECERLQGFPDAFTDVPWRGKQSSPDGPRYKALGNSMAVNAMRWIGMRIDQMEKLIKSGRAAA